jgi:hypothetical protein
MSVKNRFSPKRPLVAAAVFTTVLGGLYAVGYRGRYKADSASMDIADAAKFLALLAIGSFVVFYVLRMLGVQIGWMGGNESSKDSNDKGKR